MKVFGQLAALEIARIHPDPKGLETALRWDPDSPESHFLSGLVYRDTPEAQDLEKATFHLEEAIRLNPFNWHSWIELGRTRELRGSWDAAEEAYRKALQLNPRAASFHWRLANFYLRQGRWHSALSAFGRALQLNPMPYLQPSLHLLWFSGVPLEEILKIWPQEKQARLQMIRFLLEREADQAWLSLVWEQCLEDENPPSFSEGDFYIRHLIHRGNYRECRSNWVRLAARNGLQDPAYRAGENYLWNGDFTLPLTGGVLDWRIQSSEEWTLRPGGRRGGLSIEFRGDDNPDFSGLEQLVVLDSAGEYELRFRGRSEKRNRDSGLHFEVAAGPVVVATPSVVGTSWSDYSVRFRVDGDGQFVKLRLRRPPSRRIDGRLRGMFQLESVRLRKVSNHAKTVSGL